MPKAIVRRWTILLLFARLTAAESGEPKPVDVLTGRYTVDRAGANLRETSLTAANISGSRFGKLFEREVDGDIYAQPLIKTAVQIPGRGRRDVVYIATASNHLYAFDAAAPEQGEPYWHIGPALLGEPVSKRAVTDLPTQQEYLNFADKIGIVATPVIDDQSSTLYLVAQSVTNGEYRFRLHAFDLATGVEKNGMGSPTVIDASYNGNGVGSQDGKIRLEARKMLNRPALLLVDGVLYLAFAAHLDGEPSRNAHGWVLAYSARNLQQISALCTTPDGILGGIWQSGAGLAAQIRDKIHPLIYAVTGNGSVGGRNFAQSVLQLYPDAMLSIKLAYTPEDHAYQNERDLDLSTGPVLLPGLPLALACSKEGRCYVVNMESMRLVQDFQAGRNSYGNERAPNIHGTPVVWKNAQGRARLYVWAEEDFLRAYEFDGQRFDPAGKSAIRAAENSMPGGILSLSANGTTPGSAIVWASLPLEGDANARTVEGVLRAFDATNVEKELWNSERLAGRDKLGLFAKFCSPVVANGRVYAGTFATPGGRAKLVVYGLLPASAKVPSSQ